MSFGFAAIVTIIAALITLYQFSLARRNQPATSAPESSEIANGPFNREAVEIAAICGVALFLGISGKTAVDWLARPVPHQLEARLEFERAAGDLPSMRAEVAEIKAERLGTKRTDPNEQANVEQCANLRAKQLALKSDLAEIRASPSSASGNIASIERQLSELEKEFATAETACSRLGRSKLFAPLSKMQWD